MILHDYTVKPLDIHPLSGATSSRCIRCTRCSRCSRCVAAVAAVGAVVAVAAVGNGLQRIARCSPCFVLGPLLEIYL